MPGMSTSTLEHVSKDAGPDRAARNRLLAYRVQPWRRWYWALLPLLALVAYATVLRVGFLSDDLTFAYRAASGGVDLRLLLPDRSSDFYRAVGELLTWRLGWLLFGYNPLPYHMIGLALHVCASLMLGLWLAEVTGRRSLGWLAGALFAVFPLHLEAVGWVAAQWDEWAALFGLLSL